MRPNLLAVSLAALYLLGPATAVRAEQPLSPCANRTQETSYTAPETDAINGFRETLAGYDQSNPFVTYATRLLSEADGKHDGLTPFSWEMQFMFDEAAGILERLVSGSSREPTIEGKTFLIIMDTIGMYL